MNEPSFVRVVTPPAAEPLTLDEAKLHLREDGTDQDDLIEALITATRMHAERRCRRSLVQQTLELTLPSFPCDTDVILLPRPPLISVESVKYVDFAGNLQTVAAADYQVDTYSEPGKVKPVYLKWWQPTRNDFNAVQVRYIAGYAPQQGSPQPLNYLSANVPEGIKQWMRVRIAQLYEHREAVVVGTIIASLPDSFVDGLLDPFIVSYFK